jgi:hypothetical protein
VREGFTFNQIARAFARVVGADRSELAGRSTQQWIDSLGLGADAAMVLAAFVRVSTYVGDLDRLPAAVAVGQMRTGLKGGVEYLDGGWEQLTSGLLRCATAAGAQVRLHAPAQHLSGGPGGWQVHTEAEVIRAAAVVVAAGRPGATRRLLPVEPGWGDMGPAVTAACLDLGLRRPGPRFVLGVDEPLYLSPHSPPGDLAPPGCGLVHLMRYGSTSPAEDRQQLWEMAAAAGITQADVLVQRFLPRHGGGQLSPVSRERSGWAGAGRGPRRARGIRRGGLGGSARLAQRRLPGQRGAGRAPGRRGGTRAVRRRGGGMSAPMSSGGALNIAVVAEAGIVSGLMSSPELGRDFPG